MKNLNDIPGLKHWIDADDPSTILVSSDNIEFVHTIIDKAKQELSINLDLELGDLPSERKGYIFSYTENGVSLTAYIKNGFLYYGIHRVDNENQFLKISVNQLFNTPHLFTFFYSATGRKEHKFWICIDNQKAEEKTFIGNIDTSSTRDFHVIGASMEIDNFGIFKLFEHMIYSRILTEKEQTFLLGRSSGISRSGYFLYDGGQYYCLPMANDYDSQEDKESRPKLVHELGLK